MNTRKITTLLFAIGFLTAIPVNANASIKTTNEMPSKSAQGGMLLAVGGVGLLYWATKPEKSPQQPPGFDGRSRQYPQQPPGFDN